MTASPQDRIALEQAPVDREWEPPTVTVLGPLSYLTEDSSGQNFEPPDFPTS